MNNFFGIPIFQNNPQRVSRAQQQKRRIGYFLFHGYDTNFPFDLENRFIVVGDDEDDDGSDDDVIEIGSGHSKNDPKFLGPVEMVTIEVGGFEVQMPKIQDYVIEAFNESLKLEPTIQLELFIIKIHTRRIGWRRNGKGNVVLFEQIQNLRNAIRQMKQLRMRQTQALIRLSFIWN